MDYCDYPRTSSYTCVMSPVGIIRFLATGESGHEVSTTGDVSTVPGCVIKNTQVSPEVSNYKRPPTHTHTPTHNSSPRTDEWFESDFYTYLLKPLSCKMNVYLNCMEEDRIQESKINLRDLWNRVH